MGISRFNLTVRDICIREIKIRPRVLYVEDEDINWEIAEHELEEEFELSRALSARDAFRLISQHVYDLILLDIQLCGSDIDGIKVARLLKGQHVDSPPDYAIGIRAESTPILFVTGYTARYPREDLLAAGGEDVIAKPVDYQRLSLAMAQLRARGAGP